MNDLKGLLPTDWKKELSSECEQEYFRDLEALLAKARQEEKIIHPDSSKIFYALDKVSFEDVKIVILGQDPYHGQGQAMGLSFSVPKGIKIPPSLRNIFRELMNDIGIDYPTHGDLTKWADQGVLLLNAILTVEHKLPASHSKYGWGQFTDKIIQTLSDKRENLVFLLWGKFAQSKKVWIDSSKHLILEAAHPSPLARDKFQGCKHFSRSNQYLISKDKEAIDWKI